MAQQKLSVFKVYQNTKRTEKLLISVFDHGYQDGNRLQWKTLSQLPQVLRLCYAKILCGWSVFEKLDIFLSMLHREPRQFEI